MEDEKNDSVTFDLSDEAGDWSSAVNIIGGLSIDANSIMTVNKDYVDAITLPRTPVINTTTDNENDVILKVDDLEITAKNIHSLSAMVEVMDILPDDNEVKQAYLKVLAARKLEKQ